MYAYSKFFPVQTTLINLQNITPFSMVLEYVFNYQRNGVKNNNQLRFLKRDDICVNVSTLKIFFFYFWINVQILLTGKRY